MTLPTQGRFTVNRLPLLSAVATVTPVIEEDGKPLFQKARMYADTNGLLLTGTDEENTLEVRVPLPVVESAFATMVNPALLGAILTALASDDQLVIEGSAPFQSEEYFTILGRNSDHKIAVDPADGFPPMPPMPTTMKIHMKSRDLLALLHRVCYAMADENHRWSQAGVQMTIQGKTLRLCASDSRRLSCVSMTVETARPDGSWLVSRRTIASLVPMLSIAGDGIVTIAFDATVAHFATDSAHLCALYMDGKFPPVDDLLDKSKRERKGSIAATDLARVLCRVGMMTDDINIGVRLSWKDGRLTATAKGMTTGFAQADIDSPDMIGTFSFAVVPQYLQSFLDTLRDGDSIFLDFLDDHSPLLFSTSPDYRYMVMPISEK